MLAFDCWLFIWSSVDFTRLLGPPSILHYMTKWCMLYETTLMWFMALPGAFLCLFGICLTSEGLKHLKALLCPNWLTLVPRQCKISNIEEKLASEMLLVELSSRLFLSVVVFIWPICDSDWWTAVLLRFLQPSLTLVNGFTMVALHNYYMDLQPHTSACTRLYPLTRMASMPALRFLVSPL